MPYNAHKVLEDIYKNVAKLNFGDLLLVQAQISEHIFNCWQHHQLLKEVAEAEKDADKKPKLN